jgi:hypothetical protein
MSLASARAHLSVVVSALLVSCVTGPRFGGGAPDGATVVRGTELTTSGVLLEALALRVPGMRVTRPTGDCPLVSLRGDRGPTRAGNPAVYVDGTRMSDTCVLLQIASADVDRVELYPLASARVEGYVAGPGGLILVFRTRRGGFFSV